MKFLRSSAFVFAASSLRVGTAWAQDAEACAACGTCLGGVGIVAVLPFVIAFAIFALHIGLLVWVARDAKARGLRNSMAWMMFVLAAGVLAFGVYWFSRPKGKIVECKHCDNKRLEASAKCPSCGNP